MVPDRIIRNTSLYGLKPEAFRLSEDPISAVKQSDVDMRVYCCKSIVLMAYVAAVVNWAKRVRRRRGTRVGGK